MQSCNDNWRVSEGAFVCAKAVAPAQIMTNKILNSLMAREEWGIGFNSSKQSMSQTFLRWLLPPVWLQKLFCPAHNTKSELKKSPAFQIVVVSVSFGSNSSFI